MHQNGHLRVDLLAQPAQFQHILFNLLDISTLMSAFINLLGKSR